MITLVALLALTTGAWAQKTYTVKIEANGNSFTKENVALPYTFLCDFISENGELDLIIRQLYNYSQGYCANSTPPTASGNDNVTAGNSGQNAYFTINAPFEGTATVSGLYNPYTSFLTYDLVISIPDYVPASSGPEVAWDGDKKTGTFTMPGGNVELEPEYYPQAELTAEPTAINDVPATTDGAIVNAGTVANIDGTTTAQGTVMYYAVQSATAPTAPDYDATGWTDKVPTAADFAEGNVYVWYYVKGADGDETSTFSDGAITKLGESGYITLLAAPTYAVTFADDTAEPDKWTASPNADVKKGQTVTVTYTGSKKVLGVKAEKKAAAATLQTVNITGDTSATLYYLPGETFGQAIANHPENSSFEIQGGYITCNGYWLCIGYYDGDVTPDTLVEANGDYRGLLA